MQAQSDFTTRMSMNLITLRKASLLKACSLQRAIYFSLQENG